MVNLRELRTRARPLVADQLLLTNHIAHRLTGPNHIYARLFGYPDITRGSKNKRSRRKDMQSFEFGLWALTRRFQSRLIGGLNGEFYSTWVKTGTRNMWRWTRRYLRWLVIISRPAEICQTSDFIKSLRTIHLCNYLSSLRLLGASLVYVRECFFANTVSSRRRLSRALFVTLALRTSSRKGTTIQKKLRKT